MQKSVLGLVVGTVLSTLPIDVAKAQENAVVELFTSQGCSSCPPADEFFGELRNMPGVIALSLHVDYWDYIGWEDTLADPKFTKRQHNYAIAENSKMVYTPQVIVGGVMRAVGTDKSDIAQAIHLMQSQANPVSMTATRDHGQISIQAQSPKGFEKGAAVYLVRYQPEVTVDIGRGENAGRTVTYYNVVQSWEEVGRWAGTDPLSTRVDAVGEGEWVVIIQQAEFGEILAAAKAD